MKCCKICGKPIERFEPILRRNVACLCACGIEERNRRRDELHAHEEYDRVHAMVGAGVSGKYKHVSFEAAAGLNQRLTEYCKRYAAAFEQAEQKNEGLLFWGDVGTGKTFLASCIVNNLLEHSISAALMTESFLVNEMGGYDTPEKNDRLTQIANYRLFVLDDLGAGRSTEYFQSRIFDLIDARYQAQRPTIVTTNLTLSEMQKATDTQQKRIFDRVLEMCVPVRFAGGSFRKEIATGKKSDLQSMFSA